MKTNIFYILAFFFALPLASQAQEVNGEVNWSFLDMNLPMEERVDILVNQMTLKEKTSQMIYTSPAISRLKVPEYNWWNESLHGVARAGYATVFPQSITVAAAWNEALVKEVATAISDEARAKHHEFVRGNQRGIYQGLNMWSPNVNIFRDPRWGRGHETYGEDPYLTSRLGYQYVTGLQGDDDKYLKLVATAKHYAVHSGPEKLRHEFDANVSDRDLYETYLPAFKTLVKDAKVYSVMGAYNLFRGKPCCANPYLHSILRDDWGFDGYIVSDCWAVRDFYTHQPTAKDAAEASAIAVRNGTNLNCGSAYAHLDEAIERGLLNEEDINISVKRIFLARFKMGMFDEADSYAYGRIPYSVNCSDEHNGLSRKAAQESIILLKNQAQTLPLKKNLKKIAVIGPNADNWEALVGNYHGLPKNPITVLEGIKNKVGHDVEVAYAEGSHLAEGISNLTVIPSAYFQTEDGQQGITGEYFNNRDWSGAPLYTRKDDNIDFYWEQNPPSSKMEDDNYSVKWTGYLVPPTTGDYRIGVWSMPKVILELDGEEIFKAGNPHHASYLEEKVHLQAGKRYKVTYFYSNHTGDGDAKMLWSMPNDQQLEQAVALAESSDVAVVVLGLSQRLEGEEGSNMPKGLEGFEEGDRTHLKLPQQQQELLKAVQATGKPTVLVLMTGSAVAINWAQENVPAIMQAGYPGQQGGNAIADVLFGDYNPAGRLPVTYYKSVDQLPAFTNYDMQGRTYRYFKGDALYDFGFGLSYTNFEYSDLKVANKITNGSTVAVEVTVTNTGAMDGDEVVQLYLTDKKASTLRPIRQLAAFERIHLKKGASQVVKFSLTPEQFSMINKKGDRVVEPGTFTINVGGRQPSTTGATSGSVQTSTRIVGKLLKIEK
ncbi:glycoside hydrolase family 3 protein [Persicobacter psychrovividus]|uniref:Glucan 1,4-alpha-glucosidase n=1 Tax=Persicobacter psychrovividus TaxID=387638 RepID=A0ABN6LC70_9BACT|nr:glucan 1,4-alpha-glucosidase [Persicobacter psychrovividus]